MGVGMGGAYLCQTVAREKGRREGGRGGKEGEIRDKSAACKALIRATCM